MGEFTIGQIRTPEDLDLAYRFLQRIFPSQEDGRPGPGLSRERPAGQSPVMLAARRDEEIAGVALGHVDGGGLGTVDQLAVAAAVRGGGLGRRLLAALESEALSLGARQLTLGSVDGAVGFYQRCGYRARLLLQFVPPARRVSAPVGESASTYKVVMSQPSARAAARQRRISAEAMPRPRAAWVTPTVAMKHSRRPVACLKASYSQAISTPAGLSPR